MKAEATNRREKECQDQAAERETKRTKLSSEEGQTGGPITTMSSSSSSSSGEPARTGSPGDGNRPSSVDNKRKADGEHPEDPGREDGKWMMA